MERRPRQLKDFLLDESNSCSSTGFKSYPRQPPNAQYHRCPSSSSLSPYNSGYYSSSNYSSTIRAADPTVKKLIQIDRADTSTGPTTLQRSRSKSQAAADATISAIQKLLSYAIDTVSIAPRRSGRGRSKFWDNKKKKQKQQKITTAGAGVNEREVSAVKVYKVKDILRWKSFRDLVAEKQSQQVLETAEEEDEAVDVKCPLDSSDFTAQMAKTSTGSTYTASSCTGTCSTSASNSKGSSWGGDNEFSFTVEELPCWWSNSSPRIGGIIGGSDAKIFSDRPDEDGDKRSGVAGKGDDDREMESTEETTVSDVGPEKKDADNFSEEEDDEEGDQNSPVSVLDHESPFTEGEDDVDENYSADDSSFHQSLANVERTKSRLLQSLQWFENLAAIGNFDVKDDDDDLPTKDDNNSTDSVINSEDEDENETEGARKLQEAEEVIEPEVLRAQHLIHHMKSTSCMIDNSCEQFLFDFFIQGLRTTDQSHDDDERFEMLMENEARAYISRRVQRMYSTGVTKAAVQQLVIREMERESRWSADKYEQKEKEQLVLLMEKSVLNTLVDEILVEML